ncbi:MAG: TonB-dependent receptor [Terracidiphilus sp.]
MVTASGQFRDEQTLRATTLLEEAPGTSPIQSLAQLPSVNYQDADPYGSYEWAVRISVRGFNQNQLGFTLDDIPLGDMSYGNWNGLDISRAITDENLGRVVLSQGTGSLATASNSNLGGTIQFYSADPSDQRSLIVNQTVGSWSNYRTFARLESGLMGHTKFYLSGVYNLADKWRGHGTISQNYWQINGKMVHYIGGTGELSLYVDVSDRREVDYQDDNKVWVQKLGYNWDNWGNWANAIQAAYACDGEGAYPSPVNTLTPDEDPCDAGYYGGSGLRKDTIGGITWKQAITDHLSFKLIGYGHHDDGRGLWFTPYVPTYSGVYSAAPTFVSPISLRTSEYQINRAGFLASLAYENARNKLEGGVWFEGNRWNLARRYYATSVASPLHSLVDFPSDPMLTQWEYIFRTTVYQIHLQDQYRVNDRLTLSAGFKTVETSTDGELSPTFLSNPPVFAYAPLQSGLGYSAGKYAQGSLTSGKPFLPQFGADYKLDKTSELFGDAAYNVRAYTPGGYGYGASPWNATQAGYDYATQNLKPETSWTEEAGYRYNSHLAAAQVSLFRVNYQNRLLAFSQGVGIIGAVSILGNAGSVTTNGVDGAVTINLGPKFSLYNGGTWDKSVYDDNVPYYNTSCANNTCIYNTKGKINVDSPKGMYKTSLNWHQSGAFVNIGSDYMSTRYFTYSNDGSVAGRFLAEIGAGYQRDQMGEFKDLRAQLNITNLLNSEYWATIGTNGFIYSDPLSIANNTLQVGAPRTISGTVSVRF